MTQPSLLFDAPVRTKKRGRVPTTSVEAYRQTDADGRTQVMLSALMYCEVFFPDTHPTSAELAQFIARDQPVTTDDLLYCRRGLSDALAKGLVEHAGKRTCSVSGKTALTWKVRTR